MIVPPRQGKFVFYQVTDKLTALIPRFFDYLDGNDD